MQLSTSECFMTEILNCGVADLCMLDGLYETIGDEIYYGDRSDMLQRAVANGQGLNGILYEFYTDVTLAVGDGVEDIIEDNRDSYIEVAVKDNAGNVTEYKYLLMTDNVMVQLQKKADELRDTYPFCNCLDTSFQNDLDQTIDWEASVQTNAENLIQYWFESEELELTEEDFEKNP